MADFDLQNIKIHDEKNDMDFIKKIIEETDEDEPFYILDIENVIKKHKNWLTKMPRVVPHYAVKCNPDPTLIRTLAALNANFDCASKPEIQLVMKMGVSGDRIIYAHPGKAPSHIRYAKKVGVEKTTVDSKSEILKLKNIYPEAKLLIRLALDGSAEQCGINFSQKFGCEPTVEAIELIKYIKDIGMTLLGFCFHLGSPCYDTNSYGRSINVCKNLINIARTMGHSETNMIDIGGGMDGQDFEHFNKVAISVNSALEDIDPSIKIISEPGRYFVDSAFTLSAFIIGKKIIKKDDNVERFYYVNDGTYGAFIEELLDIQHRIPISLYHKSDKMYRSTIWGRTADPYDILVRNEMIQDFQEGDWMIWKNMGAYSISNSTHFNGFIPADVYPFIRKSSLDNVLAEIKNSQDIKY